MALSQKTIDIIKSTVPVLEVHGVTITSTFYKNMFSNHPELLNIFNHANQSQGRQQTALANMVLAAAKNIDQLESVLPAVVQVAHKHRGLGVKPEHYPIVGKHLLEAIKEVLGDAATDEIINAWAEAYGVIAQVFIDIETNMYESAKGQIGGWGDFKELEVVDKVKESDVITSFYFKAKDGQPLPTYEPGQYITVRVQIPGEKYMLNRQYSLSCAPGNDYYRISVKREADFEPNGKVSNYIHDHLNVGDTIEASAPAGNFILNMEETAPVALISGGVGLTPMMSMLETLVNSNSDREVTFIHSARNERVHAFSKEACEMAGNLQNGRCYYAYQDPVNKDGGHHFTGHFTKEFLAEKISNDTICYVCGPVPFLKNIVTMLSELGVSDENIRYEFFGPAMALEKVGAAI
ncbi:MAG TPA: NO-inducible flavohemoprotein [Bacillus bacterium]|uniref:Flavohemoprotein n=1 Tax=Siminovitchia fordii TaxID=254759 RepID=A0ABQ4KDH0_9BACI|nr:NO-inducible flavohemoprotein [Siminovitchia fordii]GIN23223.1 flavohemoprotein [Siminovitchia fordii]HBZ11219.1 NO-inducible flavohemoprotein [Bacillus sp. (in: firmicutes)]